MPTTVLQGLGEGPRGMDLDDEEEDEEDVYSRTNLGSMQLKARRPQAAASAAAAAERS